MQVEGRRLNGEPELDPSREPISIPTALFQFYHGVTALGDVCSRIDSITEGYLNPLPNGRGRPTWCRCGRSPQTRGLSAEHPSQAS